MDTLSEDLLNIELNMFHNKKKVFSGLMKDLPLLDAEDHLSHQVEIFGSNGSPILSMNYGDFKEMLSDRAL